MKVGLLVREALNHERRGRWSAAGAAIAAALTVPHAPQPTARGRRRREPTGIAPGTVLRHVCRGVVEAECTVIAEGDFRVGGVSYPDLSSAANAAAAALGRKSKTLNGWVYWGVDEQKCDELGWDQRACDPDEPDDVPDEGVAVMGEPTKV